MSNREPYTRDMQRRGGLLRRRYADDTATEPAPAAEVPPIPEPVAPQPVAVSVVGGWPVTLAGLRDLVAATHALSEDSVVYADNSVVRQVSLLDHQGKAATVEGVEPPAEAPVPRDPEVAPPPVATVAQVDTKPTTIVATDAGLTSASDIVLRTMGNVARRRG